MGKPGVFQSWCQPGLKRGSFSSKFPSFLKPEKHETAICSSISEKGPNLELPKLTAEKIGMVP